MKPKNLLLGIARSATFHAAIVIFVAGSSILISCKKESTSDPEAAGERLSGYVQDNQKGVAQIDDQGSNNGYFWSLYREGGSASLTFPNGGGNFQITYSNVNDVVGGKGWNPGSDSRVVNYNIGYLSGSYNFIGVYGWTKSPLIEYYVAEKGSMTGGTSLGTMSSDGHTYSVYKQQRVNAPSIQGTATFWQYKDTWGGAPTQTNSKVTMANHISNWKSQGGQGFGSHDYMIFALEAFSGKSGSMNATVW